MSNDLHHIQAILNDPDLVSVVDHHFDALEQVYRGDLPEHPCALSGIWGTSTSNPFTDPEACTIEQLQSLARIEYPRLLNSMVFRPGICGQGGHGVHFMETLLGAEVFDLGDVGNWQNHVLTTPVGSLAFPDWQSNPIWRVVERAATCFIDSGVRSVVLALPCISSPLNIAINLYGSEFLVAMLEEPEAVHHDLRVIADLMIAVHGWYIERIPSRQRQANPITRLYPGGYGHLCGCSATMVSRELYQEFVLPYEREVLRLFPNGGMMHLCGFYTHLIPAWINFPEVRVFQLNDDASADLPEYYPKLPQDRVFYNLECSQMSWRDAERVTGGRRIVHTCAMGEAAERWCEDIAASTAAGEHFRLREACRTSAE